MFILFISHCLLLSYISLSTLKLPTLSATALLSLLIPISSLPLYFSTVMAPELDPVSLPCPRRRPRAATAMQPTTSLGPPAISLSQTLSGIGDRGAIGTAPGK